MKAPSKHFIFILYVLMVLSGHWTAAVLCFIYWHHLYVSSNDETRGEV